MKDRQRIDWLRFHHLWHAVTVFVLLLWGVWLTGGPQVMAHSSLEAVSPENEATLEEVPEQVDLWFNEPVKLSAESIQVSGPGATNVVNGEVYVSQTESNHVIAPLQPDLANGTYLVRYHVISQDGHPIQGTLKFTIHAAQEESASAGEKSGEISDSATDTAPEESAPVNEGDGAKSAAPSEAEETENTGLLGLQPLFILFLLVLLGAGWLFVRGRRRRKQ